MKILMILFMFVLCSRSVNAQQWGVPWDSVWHKKGNTYYCDTLTYGTIGNSFYLTQEVKVTYDTIKCIMLCSDTAGQVLKNGWYAFDVRGQVQQSHIVHNHEVFWQSGYEVTTNIWSTHVVYLDDMKKPFPYFVWLSTIAK
jgi:hypothetical protein